MCIQCIYGICSKETVLHGSGQPYDCVVPLKDMKPPGKILLDANQQSKAEPPLFLLALLLQCLKTTPPNKPAHSYVQV
jgi:hypothetical protein